MEKYDSYQGIASSDAASAKAKMTASAAGVRSHEPQPL